MPVINAIKPYDISYFTDGEDGIRPGDFFRTDSGAVLLAVEVRRTTRRKDKTEYKVRVQPLGRGAVLPKTATVHELDWWTHAEMKAARQVKKVP